LTQLISNSRRALPGFVFWMLLLCLLGGNFGVMANAGTGVPDCLYPPGAPAAQGIGRASVQATSVGETQLFWAFAQGFFTGYYILSATCQDTSANAYYFAEDAYINDLTASTLDDDSTLYAAANGGLYRSFNWGQSWERYIPGLPTATGEIGALSLSEYNHRCLINCLFSRAEYGGTYDTMWVGTEFGPFWRSPTVGDSLELRASLMATDEDGFKPAVHDILGHPIQTQVLWAGTEDGIYMTRNAKNWKHISGGLPPSEGTTWTNDPVYAVFYDSSSNQLAVASSKGVFYGQSRPLGTSATAEIIVSWKPLGGEVAIAGDTLFPPTTDMLRLTVPDSSDLGVAIGAGQSITVLDTSSGIHWSAFVDASPTGLYALLTNDGIFYWPSGSIAPAVNYQQLDLDHLVAYAFSGTAGSTIVVEFEENQTTFWLGTENGLLSYQITGDILERYESDSLTIGSSHDSLAIYKIASKGSEHYIAANQGLFQTSDLGGSWQRLTTYIYNSDHTDSMWVDTRTVAFGPGDKIYTGGYLGGFLRSEDGENFVTSNLGMMHRNGTLEQIADFADVFEDSTAADSTMGIFELAQEWWGNLPADKDIDGDPRVGLLFLDIDDQYYLSTGDGTFINGYYDGKNEYSQYLYSTSNLREMFYLDTDPQWINDAGPAACNQMFNLINFNLDFNEALWLRAGLASFTQWAAGYPLDPERPDTLDFPRMNDLTAWIDGDNFSDDEYAYSFLLVLYLYEQIFPDDSTGAEVYHTLTEVASSPYQGLAGLGRLIAEKNYPDSITSDAVDYTQEFADIFADFVMAGCLDMPDSAFYQARYGFKNQEVRMPSDNAGWYSPPSNPLFFPPYKWDIPFWSGRAIHIKDIPSFNEAYPVDTLLVNGDNNNQFDFTFIFSPTNLSEWVQPGDSLGAVTVIQVDSDSANQKGVIVVPDTLRLGNETSPINFMRLLTVCTSSAGNAGSCYVLDDDASPPVQFFQTISQNPIDDRYLDIYSFADEHLYPDGGLLYQVETVGLTELEGPRVAISGGTSTVSGNDTTITLDQNIFFANEDASTFVYHIAHHLDLIQFPANLEFVAYAEDAGGNEASTDTAAVSLDFMESESGGSLSDVATGTNLTVPPGALTRDAYVLLSISEFPSTPESGISLIASPWDDSHRSVGPLVSAGCAGVELNAPMLIEIPFDPILAGGEAVGVYRAEGGGWTYIGGEIHPETGLIQSYSWKFGQFRAMAGPLGDIAPEMPYSFKLDQNYPNPFNPSTRIQFELAFDQKVKLEIYNVRGELIARLADGAFSAGSHVINWLPQQLASGVYFLSLRADQGVLYRKMLYLK